MSETGPVTGEADEVRRLRAQVDSLTARLVESERAVHVLEAIARTASDAIYVKDLEGRYVFIDDAAARAFGVQAADFVGRTDADLFDAESVEPIRRNDEEIVRGGVTREIEETAARDGRVRTYLATKSPYRNADGDVIGLIGVSRDITDLRSSAEEIARLRALQEAGAAPAVLRPGDHIAFHAFQAVADAAPDSVYVKDADGRFIFLNRRAVQALGLADRPLSEILGRRDHDFLDAELADRVVAVDRSVMDSGFGQELDEVVDIGGQVRTYRSLKAPYRTESGRVIGLVGISRDVTRVRETEARLARAEARWQFALDTVGEGIWDWDVHAGTFYFSPHWKRMLAYAEHEVGGSPRELERRIHPDDLEDALRAMHRHLSGVAPEFRCVMRMLTGTGDYLWVRVHGRTIERDAAGKTLRMVGAQMDITDELAERRVLERTAAELERLAELDDVTGIANRRGLRRALDRAWRAAVEVGGAVHLALIDVDGFKAYNDTLGHEAGDAVLRELAAVIGRVPQAVGEVAARYGGDELALLLVGEHDLAGVLERVRCEIMELGTEHSAAPFTVSIGGVSALADGTTPAALLLEADRRLYRAKAEGRNRVVAG